MRCNKKTYHLGYFKDETDAAKAYETAGRKFHGEFAAPNFESPRVSPRTYAGRIPLWAGLGRSLQEESVKICNFMLDT